MWLGRRFLPGWRPCEFDGAFELAAGGVDIASARTANIGGNLVVDEALLESGDIFGRGHGVGYAGAGIPSDEVDLGGKIGAADEPDDFVGMLGLIVDAPQEDIFKGDPLARPQGDFLDGGDEIVDVPLAGDGHDLLADLIVGGVERDGELGADGFLGEALDARDDPGGGDGHTRFGDSDFSDEEADSVHEGVVIEERLAHAHEDEVDSVAADLDVVTLEDGDDLSGDFSGGEVADDPEFGSEAELAVDGAADLAGNADSGVVMRGGIGSVAGFAVVAFGHPDRFDGLAVRG